MFPRHAWNQERIESMKNLLLTMAAAALLGAPAQAQNLLTNPDFDTDLSGWGPGNAFIATSHEPNEDVDGDIINSGSARVNSSQESAGGSEQGGSGMIQCVNVDPNPIHDLRGWALVPSEETRNARPDLKIVWFTEADCASGFILGNQPNSTQHSGTKDFWEELTLEATSPVDAASARVFCRPRKVEAGGDIDVLCDAISIVSLPEPGDGALAGAALLALGLLARRRG